VEEAAEAVGEDVVPGRRELGRVLLARLERLVGQEGDAPPLSAQRGDPNKGPAVILAKFTSGCSVPWHWHTAAENLTVVSGKGKLEMKGAAVASPVAAGDYVYLPGKHEHQFTCISACTMFDSTEGAFDIHYIDKDGKEIPPDQALAAKKPAAKPAAKKP